VLNIYRASAGSGKTHRLTGDYIALLFSNHSDRTYRKILAVTFTNKATDEMKSRILKELHALSTSQKSDYRTDLMTNYALTSEAVDQRARKILIAILHDYSSFSISTIDKFFQQVIRAFAREIGVQGGYNLELDSDATLQQSIDNLFEDLNKSENTQLLNWLTNFAEERIEQSENWNPRNNIESLGKEIFKESYQNKAEETNRKLHDRAFLSAYRQKLRQVAISYETAIKTKSSQLLTNIQEAGLTTEDFKGGSRSAMKNLEKFGNGIFELKDTFVKLADNVENCYTKTTPRNKIIAIEELYARSLQQDLSDLISMLQKDIIGYNSATIILKNINTLGILSDLAMQIKKLNDEQNAMLISDTNMLLHRIIDNSETPFVYEKTGIHIDHFMIDEFQDTSLLQWKNFYPLVANSLAANLFNLVVGDVKQSIYRWRNSDWKLLDEQVMTDFRPEQWREINLDTNWRSDRNVVHFNNTFFSMGADILQQKLNATLQPVLTVYPSLQAHTERIHHAYQHVFQQTSERAGEGIVQIQFIDREDGDNNWKEKSLQRLPQLLEGIQDRGYLPGEVAILVKKNDEARDVIHTLLTFKASDEAKAGYSYNVMGSEGLLISSASTTRFIVSLLKVMLNPADKISHSLLNFEYARAALHLTQDEALSTNFDENLTGEHYSHLFNNEQVEALKNIKNSSIYDLVEKIISLFDLGSWYHETAFLQGFQDLVFKFTSGKNTDLNSFVQWWDSTGIKQSISTPENKNAFRVMTIHKSKGLDFKAVVIPFCDWELTKTKGNLKNILWTEPSEAPFNDLPLLPIDYNAKLAQSIFAPQYFDELMHQYIDSLNVAYVAFTRAKHELICLSPMPSKEIESIEGISTLGGLLYFSLHNAAIEGKFNGANDTFTWGIFSANKKANKQIDTTHKNINNYLSGNAFQRLKLRNLSADVWLENQQLTDSTLNFGTIMHEILQNMQYQSDQQPAIEKLVREGRISSSEGVLVAKALEKFWALPHTAEWFSTGNKILNEAIILTPAGKHYRPDRVIIKNSQATIIDYKFGDSEKPSYTNQVKNYMQLVREMGYETTGYLCYITLGKIENIDG